jgi:hypothetical protein
VSVADDVIQPVGWANKLGCSDHSEEKAVGFQEPSAPAGPAHLPDSGWMERETAEASDRVTMTTWIVVTPACIHGEDEDDPLIPRPGVVDVENVFGPRRLESITVVYREGDRLTVETTSASAGGPATTTPTTYRQREIDLEAHAPRVRATGEEPPPASRRTRVNGTTPRVVMRQVISLGESR